MQTAFSAEIPEALLTDKDTIYYEKRGSVHLLIMRGEAETIKTRLQSYQPLFLDILPLTFEEIFIYEMGGVGYDIKNIL